jgi:hypothetical protein
MEHRMGTLAIVADEDVQYRIHREGEGPIYFCLLTGPSRPVRVEPGALLTVRNMPRSVCESYKLGYAEHGILIEVGGARAIRFQNLKTVYLSQFLGERTVIFLGHRPIFAPQADDDKRAISHTGVLLTQRTA